LAHAKSQLQRTQVTGAFTAINGLEKAGTQDLIEALRLGGLTFPNRQNGPASLSECSFVPPVTGHIVVEFLRPEFDASFGSCRLRAALVPMPEAAVNKNYSSVLW
jgi:hypothetical protein